MIARRTRLLADTFFGRLFENDLFSSSVSASNGVLWILAALATPGVMFSGSQMFFYARVRAFEPELQDRILFVSQAFHVDFALAIAGLVTMLVWTSLTPDRRDALVLGALPVRPAEQARARLLALTRFFAMFAAAVSLPTAVAFTFVTMGVSTLAEIVARVAGHAAGTLMGAAFVFFTLLDVQLLLAAAFGPRAVRFATLPLQGAALLAMVAALSMNTQFANALLGPGAAAAGAVTWHPAAWFIGVYRWIGGDSRDVFAILAVRGTIGCAAAIALALVAYPLAYQRCLDKAVQSEGRRDAWWAGLGARVWRWVMSPFLRTPLERGLGAFVTATLTRNHTHRFLIGSYAGIALLCGLPMAGRLLDAADTPGEYYAWFSVPLGLVCWMAASLRVAMMLPTEPAANWVFQLTEPVDKRRVLSTAVTIIACGTALPLAVVFGGLATLSGGAALGGLVCAVVLLAGLALIELLTLTLRAVPCTCTYRPGQLRLRVLWPVYLFVWLMLAYQFPNYTVSIVGDAQASAQLAAVLFGVWAALRVWRLARARVLRAFVYDEVEPAVTTTIDLSSVRV